MPDGLGLFQPSETAYKNPNQYRDTLAAVGNKEANYLSQMDQFYAQLGESKRQFDVSTAQKNTEFEQNMAFEQEKLTWQGQQNAAQRGSSESIASGQQDIQARQTDIYGQQVTGQISNQQQQVSLIQANNEFMRNIYQSEEDRKNAASKAAAGKMGLNPDGTPMAGASDNSSIWASSDNYYNPYSNVTSPTDWLDNTE